MLVIRYANNIANNITYANNMESLTDNYPEIK